MGLWQGISASSVDYGAKLSVPLFAPKNDFHYLCYLTEGRKMTENVNIFLYVSSK